MMLRLLAAAALMGTLAAAPQPDDRGRPVILFLHGRGMLDRDTAQLRKLWLDGLMSGAKPLTHEPLIADRDVRLVWYADVLDPRSSESCNYAAGDPRAKHDAETDPQLKSFVSLVGNFLGALTNIVSDTESVWQLRTFSGDASFLGDAHKRCASEQRLGSALDRAKREGRPVILVAHSLGSLVAYDYLSARRDTGVVQRLVSLGSMLGSADLRRLLIGGDSSDAFGEPRSVKSWVNIRNSGDPFAIPLAFGRDIVTDPPADEVDQHEMVGYLRNGITAGAILEGWCGAFGASRPAGCNELAR